MEEKAEPHLQGLEAECLPWGGAAASPASPAFLSHLAQLLPPRLVPATSWLYLHQQARPTGPP